MWPFNKKNKLLSSFDHKWMHPQVPGIPMKVLSIPGICHFTITHIKAPLIYMLLEFSQSELGQIFYSPFPCLNSSLLRHFNASTPLNLRVSATLTLRVCLIVKTS